MFFFQVYLTEKANESNEVTAPSRVESILSFLDQTNRSEENLPTVRSQKSTSREVLPAATSVRSTATPSTTARHQTQKKASQSISVSQRQISPPAERTVKSSAKVNRFRNDFVR